MTAACPRFEAVGPSPTIRRVCQIALAAAPRGPTLSSFMDEGSTTTPFGLPANEGREIGVRDPTFRFWQIVLKNSKIAGLRKSRKCSALATSAAARRCRIDTRASDRFCGNSCGPLTSRRARRMSGPENFQSSTKKDFFNTIGTWPTFGLRRMSASRHNRTLP
jgi:hypothetical protein